MDYPSRVSTPGGPARRRPSSCGQLAPLEPCKAGRKSLPPSPNEGGEPLMAARRSMPQFPMSSQRGEIADARLTGPVSRRASKHSKLPRVSSTGTLLPQPNARRMSTNDMFQKSPAQIQKSLSKACLQRRHSIADTPASGALQASRSDFPQKLQPRSLEMWGAYSALTDQLPRMDPGTEFLDWPTQCVAGFVNPPKRRASLLASTLLGSLQKPSPKQQQQQQQHQQDQKDVDDFGLDHDEACSEGQRSSSPRETTRHVLSMPEVPAQVPGPDEATSGETQASSPPEATKENTRVHGPHEAMSEDTRVPSAKGSISGVSVDADDLGVKVPLAPTLEEIYASYTDDQWEGHDRIMSLAFKRFAVEGASEIARESLHDAFVHMGFLTSTQKSAVDVTSGLSKFQNLDYIDFCDCANEFASRERAAVRQSAAAFLAQRGGDADAVVDQLQEFLRSAGLYIPYGNVVAAREAAGLGHMHPEDMSTEDLMATLAACKMKEGFTKEEVAAAHEVFEELDQVLVQHVSASRWGPMAQASQLVDGLLKFTGLYCVDYLDALVEIMPSESAAEQQGLSFHEFLVWARRLRDPMMKDLWKCFEDLEKSGSGEIQLDTAISIAAKFGITLLTDAVDEILADLDMEKDSPFDFGALVQFIGAAREKHGFSTSEQEDLDAAFEKFDNDGEGELSHLQVLDLLRYQGNNTSVEQANVMMNRVDYNGNGSMDRDEFLRLMRLMREQDVLSARKSFDELSSKTGQLPTASVKDALANLQLFPRSSMLAELLREMPPDLCFSSFMRLHDQCRFRVNLDFRKSAGFPEKTLKEINHIWSGGESEKHFITLSELLWMCTDSHAIPVNTQEGRTQLLQRVTASREAAIAAGASEDEVSRGSTTDVGYYTFLHLIRGIVRESEEDIVNREKDAVSSARFESGVTAEVRRIFCDFAEHKEIKKSTWKHIMAMGGRPIDKLLARLTMVPAIPEVALPIMLKSMGAKVPSSKMQDISNFLAQSRSQVEADENTVHFSTFLRLLRWMLDADFAGISAVIESLKVDGNGTSSSSPKGKR